MNNFLIELAALFMKILGTAAKALSPLIIGLILAYLLNPAVSWFEKRLKSRGLSIFITFLLAAGAVLGLIYGFIVLILGALPSGGLQGTFETVRNYFEDAVSAVNDFMAKHLPLGSTSDAAVTEAALKKIQGWISSRLSLSSVLNTLSAISGGLVSFFIGSIAAVYLIKDKEFFTGLWEKLMVLVLGQRTHGIVSETAGEIHPVVTTFINGALVDSLIVAFLSSLVLTLLHVKFAVIIGIMGGLLNIIPYFGPFFGMIPAFLVAFFSGGPVHGILVVLGLMAVQQLDSNYIYPKIVGSTTGLHPLFVLLSVSFFGFFFGILGMLLAVPAAGIIQILVKLWAYSRQ